MVGLFHCTFNATFFDETISFIDFTDCIILFIVGNSLLSELLCCISFVYTMWVQITVTVHNRKTINVVLETRNHISSKNCLNVEINSFNKQICYLFIEPQRYCRLTALKCFASDVQNGTLLFYTYLVILFKNICYVLVFWHWL